MLSIGAEMSAFYGEIFDVRGEETGISATGIVHVRAFRGR
jgi:hypothetical protein